MREPAYDGHVALGSNLQPLAREALAACRLFSGLEEPALDLVANALRVRRFRRGEVIFHAGDLGDSLFIVSVGAVKITVTAEDGDEPAILTTIGPGGFFELRTLNLQPQGVVSVQVSTQVECAANHATYTWGFQVKQANDFNGTPVFYQVTPGYLHHYADFGFGYGLKQAPPPAFVSTVKVKQAGFTDTYDTELAVRHWLNVLMERRILPRP